VIRHAKAEEQSVWSKKNTTDDTRPLVEKGQKDARMMGEWLMSNDIAIEKNLCKSADTCSTNSEFNCRSIGNRQNYDLGALKAGKILF
jgi:phosphohistidine phosphatase SixA